ncbi:MAG: DUF3299 domain-containing protein [Chromatiales bacterium]|nr:DUF3299 domain-containing protein [Chromatiales bacterium]
MTTKRLSITATLVTVLLASGCDKAADTANSNAPATPQQETVAATPQASEPTPAPAAKETETKTATAAPKSTEPTEMEWDALIPEGWRPDDLMSEYNADELSDDDPAALELMEKLKDLWAQAPVVSELDGKFVRMPGFVVPVETNGEKIDQFLLVPYYGACIHVPPPPANQTVHVTTEKGGGYKGDVFDTVWVTGTLKVESRSSDLAEAGYQLENAKVVPYE